MQLYDEAFDDGYRACQDLMQSEYARDCAARHLVGKGLEDAWAEDEREKAYALVDLVIEGLMLL